MKSAGWNPTRRNKNIGTKKSGYSQNNQLNIPQRRNDYREFWDDLVSPVIIPLTINEHDIKIYIEPVRGGYIHACTPQDIEAILKLIPTEHLENIEVFVLRQPKVKDERISSVWGRFSYCSALDDSYSNGVYIESTKINMELKWDKKLSVFSMKEFNLLKRDGHKIETTKRHHIIKTTPATIRNTQLFRTLPHEIGHSVDYDKNCNTPYFEAYDKYDNFDEAEYIENVFSSKTTLDKEEAANRYAREFYDKYFKLGELPFKQIYNEELLKKSGLDPNWFKT